jgi:predicted metal-dependent phosphoesterase TrpH
MSGTARFDLHIHSLHSPDSSESIDQILAQASRAGLRGVALTDHNSVAGHSELLALAPKWPGLLLIPGVEVSTVEGHLLLYGVDQAPPRARPIDEILDWAKARDAVPVLAHPFRTFHGVGGAVAERALVPAIETRNGHNGSRANQRAEVVRARRQLGGTGGSDAHRAPEVGRCTTEFARPVESLESFLVELRAGRVSALGSGPGPGERVRLALATFGRRVTRGFRPV